MSSLTINHGKPSYEAWCRYEGYDPPYLNWYRVIRHTPCGVWLSMGYRQKDKFVLTHARKQWACETEKDAKESYKRRKMRQIEHLERQLKRAEYGLSHITGKTVLHRHENKFFEEDVLF